MNKKMNIKYEQQRAFGAFRGKEVEMSVRDNFGVFAVMSNSGCFQL